MKSISPRIVRLYADMSDLTRSICDSGCPETDNPQRCCDLKFCIMAKNFAKAVYGIDLPETGGVLPFIGPDGCTVPPYLRPKCTWFLCPAINNTLAYAGKGQWRELAAKITEVEVEQEVVCTESFAESAP